MAFSYGFYNSINHDRVYNAIQVSQIFDGIINDGIYMDFMDHFIVTPYNGMTIQVGAGRAWFNHTWSYNDAPMQITIEDPVIGRNRIDAITLVVDVSDEVRMNSIEVVSGTSVTGNPSKPTLTDTDTKFYHPLAYVTVQSDTTEITAANIENAVGTERSPFVTGIIETISIDELVAQWGAEWDEWNQEHRDAFETWVAQQESDMETWTAARQQAYLDWISIQEQAYEDWITDEEADYNSWISNQQSLFLAWFDRMKGQLSTDAAGHLQFEIDELSDSITETEFRQAHDICNRHTEFTRNSDGDIIQIDSANLDYSATSVTTFNKTDTTTTITTVVTYDGYQYTETVLINKVTDEIDETYTKEAVT